MQQLGSTEETLPPTCGKSSSSASSSVVFSKMFRVVVLKFHGNHWGSIVGNFRSGVYSPKVLYGIILYPSSKNGNQSEAFDE